MKRYEQLNKTLNTYETAEMQSFAMIISRIAEDHNINLDWWEKWHENQVKWLNEEVEPCK